MPTERTNINLIHMKTIQSYVFLLSLLIAGSLQTLSAQNRTVAGKVLDALQEPLPGVSVRVEGTTQGTITDIDGMFRISVPAGETSLVF